MSTQTLAPTPTNGWWRRNRWALVALPVALALAVVAAGDRVRTLWWEQDLRVPVTVDAGTTGQFHQRMYDGSDVDVEVQLDGVGDATTLPEDLVLPSGARAVQVDLTLSADPDVILTGCSLAVRDPAGTRYDYVSNGWGALQPAVACVPEDTPGPWPSFGEKGDALSDPDAEPRPRTWSVSRVVVVPEGTEVADVVLWWQLPQHVLLEVSS